MPDRGPPNNNQRQGGRSSTFAPVEAVLAQEARHFVREAAQVRELRIINREGASSSASVLGVRDTTPQDPPWRRACRTL